MAHFHIIRDIDLLYFAGRLTHAASFFFSLAACQVPGAIAGISVVARPF